jgi:glucose-1-phosphate cytidylyltransferase
MVVIGYRRILWHVMKYFAHFGRRDFILCLGCRGDLIKRFFLNYSECLLNDFVLSNGGRQLELANRDIHDWTVTFADTGLRANIGQRLKAIEKYLAKEEIFVADYSDDLTDLDFPRHLEFARQRNKIATFLSVKPNLSYHFAKTDPDGLVTGNQEAKQSGIRINAEPGDELVVEQFQRLIAIESWPPMKRLPSRHNHSHLKGALRAKLSNLGSWQLYQIHP